MTPAAVVRTYVDALDERDFATSNALQPYGGDVHWWTPDATTITHLRIDHTGDVGPDGPPSLYRWKQSVEVITTATFHNFSGMSDGRTEWGYILVRNRNNQSWRIVDWGQD